MEKDVVCGTDVDPATSAETLAYQGETYHFCSSGCRRSFEAEPTEYLDPNKQSSG